MSTLKSPNPRALDPDLAKGHSMVMNTEITRIQRLLDDYPLLLFDIDGVLVDVRPSYHETIARTVVIYLREVLGLSAPDDLLSREHAAAFKRMGGFNNDWKLVAAALRIILVELPPTPPPAERSVAGVRQAARALAALPDLEERLRRGARRILELEKAVHAREGGPAAVTALVGERNAHLVLSGSWDPATDPLVRIFQEIYLGPDLFQEVYGMRPRHYYGPPFIDRDKRIMSPAALERLAERHTLGLVSGRPRVEAEYTLKHLGLWHFFSILVGHDDVVAEMARRGTQEFLGKPHPWPLVHAAETLDPGGNRGVAYVGDSVDDVRAAVALRRWRPSLAVGCAYVHADSPDALAQMRAAGADVIIPHPDVLAPSGDYSRDSATQGHSR